MPYSPRFRALRERLAELRGRFLPRRFSKTGTYSAATLDRARAYRVLTHAEIEHYFEDRALDILQAANKLWTTSTRASVPLVACMSNIVGERKGLPKFVGSGTSVATIVGDAVGQYSAAVNRNHGIKRDNILQMLLPIGVVESDIDLVWLVTIDGFGAKRGITAHKAAVAHVIDPQDDFKTIEQIVTGIKDLDLILNKVKSKIR